jgi:predicted TIM-barrel fold metal-dependent hydrolase
VAIDVHQHLWPEPLVAELRRRHEPPRLVGWTLHLRGEPEFVVDPEHHDARIRAELVEADGLDTALISLSSPLGIESLPAEQAAPLLRAYHDGVAALPTQFRAWAAASLTEVDPGAVARALDRGCVGLQLPATALLDAAGYARCQPLLALLEQRGQPLFIHPGPAPLTLGGPAWWAPLVPYVHQMHAAWYAFGVYGRPAHPRLRVCFAMLAGLAPLHSERFAARGTGNGEVDPGCYVETSSYGPRAVDATLRVLGIDVIVHGSDRPYATPADLRLDPAARFAVRDTNPIHLLDPRRSDAHRHTARPARPEPAGVAGSR